MEKTTPQLTCAPKGLILDEAGRVAGIWTRGKKRRFQTHLFEKPITRPAETSVEQTKDIVVDGELVKGVTVRIYPLVRSFLHWGK